MDYKYSKTSKNSSSDSTRKAQLIQQVLHYQQRIAYFKQLESEIESVSKIIRNSSKSIPEQQRFQDRLHFKQKPRRSSKGSLKIKSYEVQKKLTVKQKQHREKSNKNLQKLKEQQEMMLSIQDISMLIKHEQNTQKKLQKNIRNANIGIEAIENQIKEIEELIGEEEKICAMYNEQKITKIEHIKQMKRELQLSAQNTEIGDSQKQEERDVVEENDERSQSFSQECLLNENPRKETEDEEVQLLYSPRSSAMYSRDWANSSPFIGKTTISPLTKRITKRLFQEPPDFQSFGKPNNLANRQHALNHHQKNFQKNAELPKINELQERNSFLKKQHNQLNIKKELIQTENIRLQLNLEHHKISKKLLESKVRHYDEVIESEMSYFEGVSGEDGLVEKLRDRLMKIEGELGELRGKVGVKVQHNKILGVLNCQIKNEFDQLFFLSEKLQQSI